MSTNSLDVVRHQLKILNQKTKFKDQYCVPAQWVDSSQQGSIEVNPYAFFLSKIEQIFRLARKPFQFINKKWGYEANIYSMLVRYTTAYDHDRDGLLKTPLGKHKMRETGSFLKAIAMLPYLYEMGINTVYLLPIFSLGEDEKKGTLGSPYAVKNPMKLDENLAEPVLKLDVNTECKAFFEAAKILGMKIVMEFPLRTASIDSDLAFEHPDWFYWIDSKTELKEKREDPDTMYGVPYFDEQKLRSIRKLVDKKLFVNLPKPSKEYLALFTPPPTEVKLYKDKIKGIISSTKSAKIPSAFADWPPDDNQPVWSDVTYLKMYTHPEYNYIAYNTIRMYEDFLLESGSENKELWEYLTNIIPYFIDRFDIDGAMLDMGHALPQALIERIIKKAKKAKRTFVFWEENFVISKKSAQTGFNAAVGYMWIDSYKPEKLREFVETFTNRRPSLCYFASAETHNSPRTITRHGGIHFSRFIARLSGLLPMGLPLITTGNELGEDKPINTGLDFTTAQIHEHSVNTLPLFSEGVMYWKSTETVYDEIKKSLQLRWELFKNNAYDEKFSCSKLESTDPSIIAISRIQLHVPFTPNVYIIGNQYDHQKNVTVFISDPVVHLTEKFTNVDYEVKDGKLDLTLEPFTMFCFAIKR